MDSRELKKREEKQAKIVAELLARPENQKCADCFLRGPRWASVNIGCFLCIRCAGIHRKMGTHISKVKSTNLDSWQPEWFEFMASMGNDKVNAKYLSKGNAPPVNDANDNDMDTYIRNKYERGLYSLENIKYSQAMALENVKAQQKTAAAMFEINKQQLQTLMNMGFNDEALCRHALEKYKGNLEQSVDYLIKKQRHAEKEQHSIQRSATSNASSRPNTSYEREKSRQNSNRPQQSMQYDQYSGASAHLVQMGFTNPEKNLKALQKANGNLEQAVALLVSWSNGNISNQQSTPVSSQNQQAQAYSSSQQVKTEAPQKSATEDLFGLFDAPAQQPQIKQYQQPQFSNYSQGFAQQPNPFGDQFNNMNLQSTQNQFQTAAFAHGQPQNPLQAVQNQQNMLQSSQSQANPFQAQRVAPQAANPFQQQSQTNQFGQAAQQSPFQMSQAFQQQAQQANQFSQIAQQSPLHLQQSQPFQQPQAQANPFQQFPLQAQTSNQFQQNNFQKPAANPFEQIAQPIKPQAQQQIQNPHQQLMMQQQQEFQEKQQKESILSMYRAAPAQPAFGQPMVMGMGMGMQQGFGQPSFGMQQSYAQPAQGFGTAANSNYQTQSAGYNPQAVPKPAQDLTGDIFKQTNSSANINNNASKKQSPNNDLFKDLAAFGK
ncbi:hypothetical protein HK103_002902 [Boothiomyces macroporosus]|uniref:Uncharacterized protein n=1 Tax=Boothiomyces macroporosus TaxID=261099 RepID=A0AAD5U903_9FUNG|nr:hypothetical protein HK103_002902 [Boothiomyces macroporosus]